MFWWLIGIILGKNNLWILKLGNIIPKIEDHYSGGKLANFLDRKGWPNVHILFCLHKTKFYWFVMKIKKFLLPINDELFDFHVWEL